MRRLNLAAIVAASPTDIEAGRDLIRFMRETKGPAAARQEVIARINAGAQVFPYQIMLAEFDLAQGNVTDGIKLLEKLAESADSPDHALTAKTKLAEFHLSKKDLEAAKTLVAEVLGKDSRNTAGLKLRSSIRLEEGELDAAIADARQALNEQPGSTELLLLLATAYERSGSIELADKQYADVFKASKFDGTVGLNYAAFLQRRGNVARAEDILSELAGRWPNNILVLFVLRKSDWRVRTGSARRTLLM